jgi:tetratricopeptide (TPR) repeat protein
MLGTRYERTGEMGDLREAISVARQAVESTPDDHPNRAACLNNLGVMLGTRYERTGEMGDLEEAISVAREAVESTLDDHPDRAGKLSSLGNKLGRRYERTGEMGDLEEAISVARQAVESTPDNHPDRAAWLSNLGVMLGRRYERTGEMGDLEEAISIARQAVESMPDDHRDRTTRLNNLGVMLESRYERTGEMGDLEEAISVARQAVESTPDDHPDRAAWLSNLGNKLESRYERTGEMGDLEEAISVARQAVESTSDDHPDRAGKLSNLGNKLGRRYERTGEMGDLEEAISVARQAVESTPDDHPNRAGRLNNLGNNLGSRYERTGEMGDLEDVTSCLYNAWLCENAVPFHRIQAAAQCLKLLVAQTNSKAAVSLGLDVIDLLPAVNTKFLNRTDQQFVMSTFAGVAADVCALLLASDRLIEALECLEKGRAVIIGQVLDSRSDLPPLAKQYTALAHRYETLRDTINRPTVSLDQEIHRQQVINRRREAIDDLERCIQEIRRTPGNERFLFGQSVAEMQDCAVGGTIVVVNITSFQSDAILMSRTVVKRLSLPRLLASEAEAWLSKKWTGCEVNRRERPQKNKEFLEYLAWLWDVCVRPILDQVGVDDMANALPRIYWIGTGLGSTMPFHAAGLYSPGSTENAFNRVVSSYTPSIKALRHAQHRAQATDSGHGSLVITTMPTTPAKASEAALANLPGVIKEKEKIADIADGYMPIELLDLPSADQVIDKLASCYIAHFACHGLTDHADPSSSGLILQKQIDGQEAEQDHLTVHRVSELNLAQAHIAYLSACSTAENKAARLSDEVIHVVSGFQVAGFPHVVGCLWQSSDWVCVEVASAFYKSLLQRRRSGIEKPDVALALHEAVMGVREAEWDMPLTWAQFVHFGA